MRLLAIFSLVHYLLPAAASPKPPAPVTGWTAFGDSFAAGYGAGVHYDSNILCARRSGAYSVQLNESPTLSDQLPDAFNFLACIAARSKHVRTIQLEPFRDGELGRQDFATLMVGGNDVGFIPVMLGCILVIPGIDCDDKVEEAEERLEDLTENLAETYRAILQEAGKVPENDAFRLVVIGYPKFFNVETQDCDNASLALFHGTGGELTQARRNVINDLTDRTNVQIKRAVDMANTRADRKVVRYVDVDSYFEGHRFCEPGVTELDRDDENVWFFLINGADSPLEQSSAFDPGSVISLLDGCGSSWRSEEPAFGEQFARSVMCEWSEGLLQGWVPRWWFDWERFPRSLEDFGKTFHPKTAGHRAIKQAVEDHILKHPIKGR